MPLELRLSRAAEDDLSDIWAYIAADDPNAADRYIDALHAKCQVLTHAPRMGRSRDNLRRGLRSFPFEDYVIFYRVTQKSVDVVRVLSAYRDVRSTLFG